MSPSKLTWVDKTPKFESAALTVYHRLIYGIGPGLLVLWGGSQWGEKANKTVFLEMVEDFEKGAASEQKYLSANFPSLWKLLAQLKPGLYQCIRVKETCERFYPSLKVGEVYQVPLAAAVPLALGLAGYGKGLAAMRKVVILCDEIEKFMRFNKEANEDFLRSLAMYLDRQNVVTFLGASQTGWYAQSVLGQDRVVELGGD